MAFSHLHGCAVNNPGLISSELKEHLEARKELYETAIASGLLDGDTVCTPDEISKQKLETSMLQAEKAMEAVKTDNSVTIQILEKTQAELVQVLADAKTVPAGYILPHRSVVDEETVNRVRRDFFLSSPAIQEMIKADLSFVNKVKTVQDQLEKIVVIEKEKERMVTDFCLALFSGIFEYTSCEIIYHKEEYGISSDVILSKPERGFPFMSVPLYQAFLSFKSMEEDDRKKIVQDAQELLNNMNYRVTETLTFLKAILTPQYHAIMVQNASVYEKEDEILVFLDKVNMQLNTFAGMFNIF